MASFYPSLKQNFIAYRSSKVSWRPDCIFEIHQQWQSGCGRMYSNSCCCSSFEAGITKIGQSSYKVYSNNIMNFQESTTILNSSTKKSGNFLKAPRLYLFTYTLIGYRSAQFMSWAFHLRVRVSRQFLTQVLNSQAREHILIIIRRQIGWCHIVNRELQSFLLFV